MTILAHVCQHARSQGNKSTCSTAVARHNPSHLPLRKEGPTKATNNPPPPPPCPRITSHHLPHLRRVSHNGPLLTITEPPKSAVQYGRQLIAVSSAGVADGPQSVGGVDAYLEVTVLHDSPSVLDAKIGVVRCLLIDGVAVVMRRERDEFARGKRNGGYSFSKAAAESGHKG